MRRLPVIMALIAATVAASGCGGGGSGGRNPLTNVPAQGGLRAKLGAAADPVASEFPATKGRTLQEMASSLTGGPQAALAGSIFTVGENRLAFGVVDSGGKFVYGKTAVYIAPKPGAKARGPFVAPADLLITDPAFRSQQAATDTAPFAAVYNADVRFSKPGNWAVLTVTQSSGGVVGAATRLKVLAPGKDPIPEVGQPAPRIATDTLASAKGDEKSIDTRVPPAPGLHKVSFAAVVGKQPVALLIATPQLCQSRVCGPVTDIALQLQAKYGARMQFIHQEVYAGNDPNKGLREPLKELHLQTEPWLFVVNKSGKITARLEGSFGLKTFEKAIATGL
jgi:hypothetical protein